MSFCFGERFSSMMGELIFLEHRMADRTRRPGDRRVAFFFDPSCPFSYLAAERVERNLGNVEWVPTAGSGLSLNSADGARSAAIRAEAEQRAGALRLPLVWPDRFPQQARRALRAAAYAAEQGAASRFALAACRLAFCGGFDLDDAETLAEAAAAAGLPLDECLAAAGDPSRDAGLLATAQGLRRRGIAGPPAFHVGGRWFGGEVGLAAAAASWRAQVACGRPLAPAS